MKIDDDILDYVNWLYPDDGFGGRSPFDSFSDLWDAMMSDELLPRFLG